MADGAATVLLVDDTDVQRYAIARLIRNAGYNVIEAATGGEALAATHAATQPDVVVLDVKLPDISGLEVCRRIKADPETAYIPVLQLSAMFVSASDRAAGLEGGADAYLAQPADPAELIATIRALLRIRRAEEETRAAVRSWEETFNSIGDAIFVLDTDGRIRRSNRAMLALTGMTDQHIAGRLPSEVLSAVLEEGDLRRIEAKGASRDRWLAHRDSRWLDISVDPFGGAPGGGSAVVVLADVTALRTSEAALSRVEQLFRAMQSASLDGFLILSARRDSDGSVADLVYEYLNPAAERLLGRPATECLGRGMLELFPGSRQEVFPALARVVETGIPHDFEVHYQAEGFDNWFRNMAVSTGDGNTLVLSSSDITERKRAELIIRMNEKLAATGRMAASIAHEINNPMASVTNLLYLLEQDASLSESARQFVGIARQEVARMAHIVKQMLGFYRESALPVSVDLGELIDGVIDLHGRKIAESRVEVVRRYHFDRPFQAYPGELRQVVANLLANAVEAMAGGGCITVHTARSRNWQDGTTGARIVVADNGPGIRPEARAHLFEPFFTTKGEKGTGLGLWVSEGIVRKHGGHLRFRTSVRPGRSGTVFSLFLPEIEKAV